MPIIIDGVINYYSGSKNLPVGMVVQSPLNDLGPSFIKLNIAQILTRANYPDLSGLTPGTIAAGQVFEKISQLPTYLTNIAYSNTITGTRYVSIKSGKLYYSIDGVTWSLSLFTDTVNSYTVIWCGAPLNLFFAMRASSATAYTSPDGVTWTPRTLAAAPTYAVPRWNGAVICIASTTTTVQTSSNAIDWSIIPIGGTQPWVHLGNLGTQLLLFPPSLAAYYLSTDNGANWSVKTFPAATSTLVYSATDNSILVVYSPIANSIAYYTTLDGINWTIRNFPVSLAASSLVCNGTTFMVGVTNDNKFLLSANGYDWSEYPLPANNMSMYGLTADPSGTFLFTSTDYGVYRSMTPSASQIVITPVASPTAGLNYFMVVL